MVHERRDWRCACTVKTRPLGNQRQPLRWRNSRLHSTRNAHGEIELCVKESTAEKVAGIIGDAKLNNRLSDRQAGKLKGKILWCTTYGGIGSAALGAISRRESGADGNDMTITRELDASLTFLEHMMQGELPKIILRTYENGEKPTVVLSDASYHPTEGNHGVAKVAHMVWCPKAKKLWHANMELPQEVLKAWNDMKAKQTFITQAEVMGIEAPYFSSPDGFEWRDRDVIHLADNKAADCGVIKGRSPSPDSERMIANLRMMIARLRIRLWIEFVKSEANFADDPSRDYFDDLEKIGSIPYPYVIPPYLSWPA